MTKLLKDVGVTADKENVKTMINKLKGQDLTKLINDGYGKFAAIGGGGAAPAGDAGAAAPTEKPKEAEKKEEEPEEDVDMGGLFGDDY